VFELGREEVEERLRHYEAMATLGRETEPWRDQGPLCKIVRTLRDGTVTVEWARGWMAELILAGCMWEEQTASARLVR